MRISFTLLLCLAAACSRVTEAPNARRGSSGAEPDRLASPDGEPEQTSSVDAERLPAPGVVVVDNDEYWARVDAGEATYDRGVLEAENEQRHADTKLVLEEAAVRLPEASSLIVTEIPDDLTHDVVDNDGTTHQVQLMGKRARAEILRASIELGDLAALEDYKVLYESASASLRATFESPATIQNVSKEFVAHIAAQVNAEKAALIQAAQTPPANYPTRWEDEIGTGDLLGDHNGPRLAQCGGRSSIGIYQNFDWPLKWLTTSVKDQANRGTCGAFAFSSAAESREAQAGRYVNVSEQDVYFHIKGPWGLAGNDDGTNVKLAQATMTLTGYRFAYEKDWDYNPSRARLENPLRKSCDGYKGELCTNTYHQGIEECSFWTFWRCFLPKGVEIANRTSIRSTASSLLGLGLLGHSIDAIKAAVAEKKLVLFSFDVVPSFDSPKNGYVTFKPGEKGRGGHVVHLTGYISNEQLASRVPAAPPGAGGGYFILKNSWGECWADGGYAYVPVDFVRAYGTGTVIVAMNR
jgi:C1A family cysteine protease